MERYTKIDAFIRCRPWNKPRPPARILAIRLQAMGDTVITLPYLQYLRRHLPASVTLDLLTRKETRDIPRNIHLFNRVFSIGGGRVFERQLAASLLMLPGLRAQHYEIIIDLQNNLISRMVRRMLAPAAWATFDKFSSRPAGERTRLTIEGAGLAPCAPDTNFSLKDPLLGRAVLGENGWDGESSLVVLNPAAAFSSRKWPLEYYAGFARLWLKTFPRTQFVLTGTDRLAEAACFLGKTLPVINLVGNTSALDAFAVLQLATLVLSEDSGLMHMAWVSGTPTLALFGSTRSDWARPLGPHTRFLDSADLPCGNCMQAVCAFGDVHCLTRYSPERVFAEAMALLGGRPQASR